MGCEKVGIPQLFLTKLGWGVIVVALKGRLFINDQEKFNDRFSYNSFIIS